MSDTPAPHPRRPFPALLVSLAAMVLVALALIAASHPPTHPPPATSGHWLAAAPCMGGR